MALINCPNCGAKISDKAPKCPKCGYKENSRHYKSIGGAVLLILISLASAFLVYFIFFDSFPYYGEGPVVIYDYKSNNVFGLCLYALTPILLIIAGILLKKIVKPALIIAILVSVLFASFIGVKLYCNGGIISREEYEIRSTIENYDRFLIDLEDAIKRNDSKELLELADRFEYLEAESSKIEIGNLSEEQKTHLTEISNRLNELIYNNTHK